MCGILGFCGSVTEGQWTETYRILNALFVISGQQRGLDATGFVSRTESFKHPSSSNIIMDKRPLPAPEFIADSLAWRKLRHRRCRMVLGHVRWATHGDPRDNRTNHPLVGNGLWLVHNGVLTDHKATAQKHGLGLETEVDSELLLRFVETTDHPAIGLDRAMKKVEGSAAVIVHDGRRDALYMARNDRPLWLARLRNDRRSFFASTREILLAAFREVLGDDVLSRFDFLTPLSAGHVHILTPSGKLVALPGNRDT